MWQHEDTILLYDPLEAEQHGFMRAKSCDSAITNIVSHAEHAMAKNNYAVLALLDVEGAFDNATYKSMLDPLRAKGTPEQFISWISDFLVTRKSSITVKGVHREIYHTRGTPQGGCSSPYLWSCVINELIKAIKPMSGINIICYADDIALITKGPDLEDCIDRLQQGVTAVEQWAATHSLSMSHSKSEILLLTKKRKYSSIVMSAPPIKVGGVPVDYAVGPVRYLGIWLDRKLSWSDHVRIKCGKVNKLLRKAISATGRWWGLKPYQGRYFWEALGRTVLSYGCLAWHHSTRKKCIRARLRATQRLGFELMAPFRKGTPNSGLELIFNCPPMEVYLAKMATKAYFRTVKHAPFTREQLETTVVSHVSHRTWIQKLIENQNLDYLESPLDEIPRYRRWDRLFEVDVHSMLPLKYNPLRGIPDTKGINLFTDGSKKNLRTGAGVIVAIGDKPIKDSEGNEMKYNYHLAEKTTVFQSEIFALKMAATLIIHGSVGPNNWVSSSDDVTIYSDCQAAILALRKIWVKSKLVRETLDLLDQATQSCKSLTIKWVKAHVGHEGNELADTAACQGRDDDVAPDWETPLLAKAVMHAEIDKMTLNLWKKTWDEVIGCRQTRHFYPKGPRNSFFKSFICLPKPIAGQLVQVMTGHAFLNRHQAVIDESERQRHLEALDWDNADDDGNAVIDAPDPKCSRCHKGEETPLHLLSECDRLATLRLQIFGREDLVGPREIPDFSEFPPYKLIAFFREAKFETLPMLPFRAQYLPTNTSNEESNQRHREEKAEADLKGKEWTSKYLFRLPLKTGFRSKKSSESEDSDTIIPSNNENNESNATHADTAPSNYLSLD